MRPTHLMLLARWLADCMVPPELAPAAARASISRAYYAAYHTVYDFLRSFGCPLERGGKGHSDVRAWLAAGGVQDLVYAASRLGLLHEMRLAADYGLDSAGVETADSVAQALELADNVISAIEACAASPSLCESVRRNLQSAIRSRRL